MCACIQAGTYTLYNDRFAVSARALVDARFTENDLPMSTPPRFAFDAERIELCPPNALPSAPPVGEKRYVVVGGGTS